MSTPTVVRSPLDFLNALKTVNTNPPAIPQPEASFAPLSLDQVNEKIAEFSLALESPLPDPIRAEVERRRALLVTEQFRLTHGYIPDADGNNPAEVKAIVDVATQAATKSVVGALAAPSEQQDEFIYTSDGPDSLTQTRRGAKPLIEYALVPGFEAELPPDDEEDDDYDEEFDLDEQVEVLNEIDEASAEIPAAIPAPTPAYQVATGGFFLDADLCTALRASVVAGLPHVTAKITARMVELVLGK